MRRETQRVLSLSLFLCFSSLYKLNSFILTKYFQFARDTRSKFIQVIKMIDRSTKVIFSRGYILSNESTMRNKCKIIITTELNVSYRRFK